MLQPRLKKYNLQLELPPTILYYRPTLICISSYVPCYVQYPCYVQDLFSKLTVTLKKEKKQRRIFFNLHIRLNFCRFIIMLLKPYHIILCVLVLYLISYCISNNYLYLYQRFESRKNTYITF